MKTLKFTILIFTFSLSFFQAQDLENYRCEVVFNLEQLMPGSNPERLRNSLGAYVGGQKKTADGILKVLIVIVRFSDDYYLGNPYWPNYNLLPEFLQYIVEPNVTFPYTRLNLTNIFDRCSGGDGQTVSGDFQVIGDVYYVTTDNNRSYYTSDAEVNLHVIQKLDNPNGTYNVDFRKYDNWQFMLGGQNYIHSYVPFNPGTGQGGDGKVDHIFIYWRDQSISYGSDVGGYAGIGVNYTTNDGRTISSQDGSTQLKAKNYKPWPYDKKAVLFPAHEYSHFIFGGGTNTTAHFDGRSFNNHALNTGNLHTFALMMRTEGHNMSAYERYRAGWLTPQLLGVNGYNVTIEETHVKNRCYVIPMRYEGNGLKEYLMIENYHTVNDYSQANPFIRNIVFNHSFKHGLIVFHVMNEDFNFPTMSDIDIECADGRWTWDYKTGGSTPTNREDDLIDRFSTNRTSGMDEKDWIILGLWDDYMALTPGSFAPNPPPANHGRRYNSNDYLGDNKDFFRIDDTDVLTRWSNPTTNKLDGNPSDVGFEIVSYTPSTKIYKINVGVDYNRNLSFKPSKPQALKVQVSQSNHPYLTWEANQEDDMLVGGSYRIEKYSTYEVGWFTLNTTSNTYYEDLTETICPPGQQCQTGHFVRYRVRAIDNTQKVSVPSDSVMQMVLGGYPDKINVDPPSSEKPTEYSLMQNYPNPFNPTTTISFTLKDETYVTLTIFDVLGKKVTTLIDEKLTSGNHYVEFDGSQLNSGIYFYEIKAKNFRDIKKFILAK